MRWHKKFKNILPEIGRHCRVEESLGGKKLLIVFKSRLFVSYLLYINALSSAKSQYFTEQITAGAGSTRALFSLVNNFHSADHCNYFMSFFNTKIATVHHQLTLHMSSCPSPFVPHPPLSPTSNSPLPLIYQNSSRIQSRPPANLTLCHPP